MSSWPLSRSVAISSVSWLRSDKWLWLICSSSVGFCPLQWKWLLSDVMKTDLLHVETDQVCSHCQHCTPGEVRKVASEWLRRGTKGDGFLIIFKYITKNQTLASYQDTSLDILEVTRVLLLCVARICLGMPFCNHLFSLYEL